MLQYFMNGFEKVEEVEVGGEVRFFRIILQGERCTLPGVKLGGLSLT